MSDEDVKLARAWLRGESGLMGDLADLVEHDRQAARPGGPDVHLDDRPRCEGYGEARGSTDAGQSTICAAASYTNTRAAALGACRHKRTLARAAGAQSGAAPRGALAPERRGVGRTSGDARSDAPFLGPYEASVGAGFPITRTASTVLPCALASARVEVLSWAVVL